MKKLTQNNNFISQGNLVYELIEGYANFFTITQTGQGNSAVAQVNLERPLTDDGLRLSQYQVCIV